MSHQEADTPNAALKFARWLAEHPVPPGPLVSPRRPAWTQGSRPRLKALVESGSPATETLSGPVQLRVA